MKLLIGSVTKCEEIKQAVLSGQKGTSDGI